MLMSSRDLIDEVNALFRSYCASFEALDPEGIADHIAYSGIIGSDAEEVALITLTNRQERVAAVAKVVALNRKHGVPVGRIHAEHRRYQERAAVAILNVGGMHDGVHQQALRIDEDVTLLALDLLASVVPRRIAGPLFQRF
jgi:hypothetical protein